MKNSSPLCGKNILLGVCGGIAAYKAAELVRRLVDREALVRVAMTQSATKFVGTATFAALSGEAVYTDMWEGEADGVIRHIDLPRQADAVVIAPATANFTAKLAHGIADDALSTLMLATTCPVLLCPSMNVNMYEHAAVQANLKTLSERGLSVMAPGSGFLACGDTGAGRLPEPADIADRLEHLLCPKDLAGKTVLVTAGPTREYMDPVRFVSNPSSGKMGFAVARAAEHRGARVVLVTGPVALADPLGVETIRVNSAREMAREVHSRFDEVDLVVKSAAVSDYRPEDSEPQKIKGSRDCVSLSLCSNPDILAELGAKKAHQKLVGFAAETEKLAEHATEKIKKKNLDMIVANLIGPAHSGFNAETNQVTLFFADGTSHALETMSKTAVAHAILDRAVKWTKP